MSSIKPKKGKCVDCGPDSNDRYLTDKRCRSHYWQYRRSVNSSKPKKANNYDNRKELDKWFADQIAIMPGYCEECGEYLNPYAPWGAKSYIAHILAKRHFKSVMVHPLNRMFLCIRCHTNLDNWPAEKIVKMAIYPLLLQRLVQFSHQLHQDELIYLPKHIEGIKA